MDGAHDLSIPRRLEAWIAEYDAKVSKIPEALAAFESARTALKSAACINGEWGEELIAVDTGACEETMRRSLTRSAWRHFIKQLKLNDIMSADDKRRVEQMLANPLPFDRDSLRAVFGDHIQDPRGAILRGMAEVFCNLDPAFKSHEKMKIGVKGLPKRVIVSGLNGYGAGHGWDSIRNMINALAAYQRKPLVTGVEMAALREDGEALRDAKTVLDPSESVYVHRRRAERGDPAKTIRTEARGVWLKRFQNGNGHLFFGPEALRDINAALAEYYGDVLPDCPDWDDGERPAPRAKSTAVSSDLQFYPTPRAVIETLLADCYPLRGARVLEPSCGDGRIMDAARAAGADCYGVEVDAGRAQEARAKGHCVMPHNFLTIAPGDGPAGQQWRDFDFVLMNPPFYGRHYAKHVRHALRFLKQGGVLKAILPATARYDHGLLDDLRPSWRDLRPGAFRESGTNICTSIATIRRSE